MTAQPFLRTRSGPAPEEAFKKHRIKVLFCSGFIEDSVDAYFNGKSTGFFKPSKAGVADLIN